MRTHRSWRPCGGAGPRGVASPGTAPREAARARRSQGRSARAGRVPAQPAWNALSGLPPPLTRVHVHVHVHKHTHTCTVLSMIWSWAASETHICVHCRTAAPTARQGPPRPVLSETRKNAPSTGRVPSETDRTGAETNEQNGQGHAWSRRACWMMSSTIARKSLSLSLSLSLPLPPSLDEGNAPAG